jgi:lambda family phage portal protein
MAGGGAPVQRRRAKATAPYSPHFVGGTIHKHNFDFQPPHRSGNAAVRESWDLLTRRIRWLIDNTYMVKRAVELLVQLVVGEGIGVYFAGVPELGGEGSDGTQGNNARRILSDPLFRFGDESDSQWERWAEEYADCSRRRSLWELQAASARDLFGAGNSLWLKVLRPAPDGVCPTSWQLLEAEQLDDSKDRPATPGVNRIEHGIEYNGYGEPIGYWLFDANPYDSMVFASRLQSNRVPANRVVHLALTTRASQDFGISFANILMQPSRDEDWLVGHELTSAALAAGLTILIREGENDDGTVDFDTEDATLGETAAYGDNEADGVPYLSEVGLTAGTVARVKAESHEDVQVIESRRPNKDVEPFSRFLLNRASMASNLSYHRYTGNPTGASFASLRAMINDDREATLPLTNAIGRHVGRRLRKIHDGTQAALGRYQTVMAEEYGRRLAVYQDYDVVGPPIRLLNPVEDLQAAAMAIRTGQSTLRRECALRGLNYRAVLRQLAVEGELTRALGVVWDFSSGGGQAAQQTTTTAAVEEMMGGMGRRGGM